MPKPSRHSFRSPKIARSATFASIAREYDLPSYITSKKHLRWSTPIEKGIAWEIVKKIVRKKETDCYTCGRKDLEGQNASTGHCYPVAQTGSNNALSWDLRLIHLQCGYCNGPGQGEQGLYEERIRKEYGDAFLQEARQRRYKVDPIKNWDAKVEELKNILQSLDK